LKQGSGVRIPLAPGLLEFIFTAAAEKPITVAAEKQLQ
jgi:hypothetical protein